MRVIYASRVFTFLQNNMNSNSKEQTGVLSLFGTFEASVHLSIRELITFPSKSDSLWLSFEPVFKLVRSLGIHLYFLFTQYVLRSNIFLKFLFIYILIFLSVLYTQCALRTHNLKIKSQMLYWVRQPGTPALIHFKCSININDFIEFYMTILKI